MPSVLKVNEVQSDTDLPLVFNVGNAERGRIDTSGNMGIGSTPVNSRRLTINTSGQTDLSIVAASNNYAQLLFGYTGADSKGIIAYYNSDNSMQFYTNSTERARFNSSGAFVFAGGTTSADGIGITFPATQSASTNANTLDDYEEGTWTPTVQGSSTAGTTTYSSFRLGNYVKIGKQVTCWFRVSYTAATGTGGLLITGYPFAAANGTHAVGSMMSANLDWPNAGSIALYIDNGTIGYPYISADNVDFVNVQLSNESADLIATVTYFV